MIENHLTYKIVPRIVKSNGKLMKNDKSTLRNENWIEIISILSDAKLAFPPSETYWNEMISILRVEPFFLEVFFLPFYSKYPA